MAVIQPLPRIHVVRWASPFGEAVQGAKTGFISQYFQQIRYSPERKYRHPHYINTIEIRLL